MESTTVASDAASDGLGPACSTGPDAVGVQAPVMTAAMRNVSGLTLPLTMRRAARCEVTSGGRAGRLGVLAV
jgi:hypothetical protein